MISTSTSSSIKRLDAKTATYSDFAEVMMTNQPAILYNFAGLLPSFAAWQNEGRADVDFLRRNFGDMTVPVVECSAAEGYGEQRRTSMSLRQYLDKMQDSSLQRLQQQSDCVGFSTSPSSSYLYLKDWHFQRLRKERKGMTPAAAVETPCFFTDDWLNWWCDCQKSDDYRFVYIGPPGSWTPLHHDILNSYSWSFNVCGRKAWTLFPPEATPDLYDRHGRDLATDVRRSRSDAKNFPRLEGAVSLEVLQGPGEAIFVPSGWHHQVVNLGDESESGGLTISVNTNWFNGFNLARVHAFLLSELRAVRDALDHLREGMLSSSRENGEREWERQCEVVMRANSALNMTDFARIVLARARLLLLADRAMGQCHCTSPSAHPPPSAPPVCAITGQSAPAVVVGQPSAAVDLMANSSAPNAPIEDLPHTSHTALEDARAETPAGGVSWLPWEDTDGGNIPRRYQDGGVEEGCGRDGNSSGHEPQTRSPIQDRERDGLRMGEEIKSREGAAWDDDRWRLLALQQTAAVLRDLAAEPCANHLFLGSACEEALVDDHINDGNCGSRKVAVVSGSGSGGDDDGGRGDVLHVLASIEAYIREESTIRRVESVDKRADSERLHTAVAPRPSSASDETIGFEPPDRTYSRT